MKSVLLAVAAAALLAGVGCSTPEGDEGDGDADSASRDASITLVVRVPAETPVEDRIHVQSGPRFAAPLVRQADGSWSVTLTLAEVLAQQGVMEGETLRYAYTRGLDYVGGEAFPDDPVQEEWWQYRSATLLEGGSTQDDTVERWRWMGLYPEPPAYESHVTAFEPREGGVPFQAGQMIADFWQPGLRPQVEATHEHLARVGVTWMQISPPWDYVADSSTPRFDEGESSVGYSEDDLRWHIERAHADGLSVLLVPQICCSEVTPEDQRTPEWFEGYFQEYERFLLFHARVAEAAGVEAFLLDWSGNIAMPGQPGVPADAADRWRAMLAAVREVYGGPVGFNTLAIGPVTERYSLPWPWENGLHEIGDEFDFLGVSFWGAVATSPDAPYEEIAGLVEERFVQSVDALHEVFGGPVVMQAIAYGSFDGAALSEFGVFEVALSPFFQESLEPHTYDAVEQAMVVDAVMASVARRPYVLGTYTFHYDFMALPHATDYSVRGKLAEDVLAEWYRAATR